MRTTGKFYLNQDWTLGWDATLQTDRTFTRDYGVLNGNTDYTESTIHLTGLRDRNFFEARSSYFQVLTDQSGLSATTAPQYDQGRQAIVVPEIDSTKYVDHPVLGGEMSFKSNLTVLNRQEDDPFQFNAMAYRSGTTYTHGTAGTFTRLTKEVDWQRRFIGPMGQVITPFAYLRGDAFFLSGQSTAADGSPGLTTDSTAFRFMPAVGVDWSLPILATAPGATHIIEPRVQLIVRPDEMHAGTLPNNDAQSLVFDPSNLFTWDKFSGYDREEGGTRLNVGLHYHGTFDSGASVDATVGRSYQLAGTNPYATQDLAGVGGSLAAVGIAGSLSGLDTTASDYVAGATVDTGLGPRISANGRFDDADLSRQPRRGRGDGRVRGGERIGRLPLSAQQPVQLDARFGFGHPRCRVGQSFGQLAGIRHRRLRHRRRLARRQQSRPRLRQRVPDVRRRLQRDARRRQHLADTLAELPPATAHDRRQRPADEPQQDQLTATAVAPLYFARFPAMMRARRDRGVSLDRLPSCYSCRPVVAPKSGESA